MKSNVEFLDELETRARASDSPTLSIDEFMRLAQCMDPRPPFTHMAEPGVLDKNFSDLAQAVSVARKALAKRVRQELLK